MAHYSLLRDYRFASAVDDIRGASLYDFSGEQIGRHRIHDHLTIKLKHNTQHAVRSRMLRPHIEKDEVFIIVCPLHSPILRTETQRLLLCLLFFLQEVEGTHFSRPRRMILTQWMASPGLRIRMRVKCG